MAATPYKKLPLTPPLEQPIRFAKGVGEKMAILLAKKDLFLIRDLIFFLPRTYEDRRKLTMVKDVELGHQGSVFGCIRSANPVFFSRSGKKAYEMIISDDASSLMTPKLKLTWFRKPHFATQVTPGQWVLATGTVTAFRGDLQMVHADLELLGKKDAETVIPKGIIPIYSETEGLYQKTIRRIVHSALDEFLKHVPEPLPYDIINKNGWPKIHEAMRQLHRPQDGDDFDALVEQYTPAHQRLIYEEFLEVSLGMAMRRHEFIERAGISFNKPAKFWDIFAKNVGFKFTAAQRRVLQEILEDMRASQIMHRLVQGDVGCGKTAVAGAAGLIALEAGYQVALMAPTEILAEQHFRNFTKWLEGTGVGVAYLTGSLKAQEKRQVLEKIASTTPLIVIGTHALIEDAVKFAKLGLIIVDEQHRFGVRQRARLAEKALPLKPDVLVMTATPIPRTLALTVYGDLNISIIDELPPGRQPVETKVFTERERIKLEARVRAELEKGRQAYMVVPLIEDSETLELKSLEAVLPDVKRAYENFRIAVLHGRLKSEEKQAVLDAFRAGQYDLLVSTTVVEVGVDVPNATIMIVENAERFGLSQLHQLRGRVGRGAEKSYCFLVATHLGSEEIVKRLRTMEATHDGFKLAEVDLEMRGPGEFLGTRQAGLPSFQIAKLPRDLPLLQKARADALEIIAKDPMLKEHPLLKEKLDRRSARVALN